MFDRCQTRENQLRKTSSKEIILYLYLVGELHQNRSLAQLTTLNLSSDAGALISSSADFQKRNTKVSKCERLFSTRTSVLVDKAGKAASGRLTTSTIRNSTWLSVLYGRKKKRALESFYLLQKVL